MIYHSNIYHYLAAVSHIFVLAIDIDDEDSETATAPPPTSLLTRLLTGSAAVCVYRSVADSVFQIDTKLS